MNTPQPEHSPSQISSSFWETLKNELLLALYEKKTDTINHLLGTLLTQVQKAAEFDEETEKRLHQIQAMIKRFLPTLPDAVSFDIHKNLQCLNKEITAVVTQDRQDIHTIDFHTWEQKLNVGPVQKELIFKTAISLQLTRGCSHYCRRCNEWALPGTRCHFSFDAVIKLMDAVVENNNNDIALYNASDPLEWEDHHNQKNIYHIVDFLKNSPLSYDILTKLPRGKTALFKKLVTANANMAVSITRKNKKNITRIEKELAIPITKQHDLDELLIPARLDEDFVSIKPSIADGYGTEITPDGAFITIPTFTTALHPSGHQKIQITKNTDFLPLKRTGRDALLVDYFKPLTGFTLEKEIICLDHLLDVQTESIILDNGSGSLTPPGMRSLKEYLEIFDDGPRLRRKKMTPSVFKRLKQEYLNTLGFKDLTSQAKGSYLKKVQAHLDLCRRETCSGIRQLAISFFLESIAAYARTQTVKRNIMKHLLEDERSRFPLNSIQDIAGRSPETLFTKSAENAFQPFRLLVHILLETPDHKTVLNFINAFPAKFDPAADLFVPQNSDSMLF